MSVKEIKELEEEVTEVIVEDDSGWEEKDVVIEDENEDEKGEEFSIGDTMLARGKGVEKWGSGNLEEELEGEDFERGFNDEDFEEEDDFGSEGFSYETVDQSGVGDLYGAGSSSSGGNLYGVGSSGGAGNLYGAPGGSDSVSLYNTPSGSGGESNLYVVDAGKKKGGMGVSYQVEGGASRDGRSQGAGGRKRRGSVSGLESGIVGGKKGRKRGVSLF